MDGIAAYLTCLPTTYMSNTANLKLHEVRHIFLGILKLILRFPDEMGA